MTIREEITLELDGVGDLNLALCGTLGHVEDSQEDKDRIWVWSLGGWLEDAVVEED